LTIPAAAHFARPESVDLKADATNLWSPYTGLVVGLLAIAIALAGTAFVLSRRRPPSGD